MGWGEPMQPTDAAGHGWLLLRRIVDEQSADDRLWARTATPTETYLQQQLARLHDAVDLGYGAWRGPDA